MKTLTLLSLIVLAFGCSPQLGPAGLGSTYSSFPVLNSEAFDKPQLFISGTYDYGLRYFRFDQNQSASVQLSGQVPIVLPSLYGGGEPSLLRLYYANSWGSYRANSSCYTGFPEPLSYRNAQWGFDITSEPISYVGDGAMSVSFGMGFGAEQGSFADLVVAFDCEETTNTLVPDSRDAPERLRYFAVPFGLTWVWSLGADATLSANVQATTFMRYNMAGVRPALELGTTFDRFAVRLNAGFWSVADGDGAYFPFTGSVEISVRPY